MGSERTSVNLMRESLLSKDVPRCLAEPPDYERPIGLSRAARRPGTRRAQG